MAKRTGQPNGSISPWLYKVKESRRAAADERNAAYNALPFKEKMARNSDKVQAKLVKQRDAMKDKNATK